jgi:drug/metabolite transporter (DMT)-like permease
MFLCLVGVLFLLSKGDIQNLRHFHFGEGDLWVLLAAFCFAVYNTLVKKKPTTIKPIPFLFIVFSLGTLLVLPFYIWETTRTPAVVWNERLVFSVLYLGIAASVFCFMIWNIAIGILGAGRTALFGNLIPVFSSIEAAIFLHEDFTNIHIISMAIVFAGIVVANWRVRVSSH